MKKLLVLLLLILVSVFIKGQGKAYGPSDSPASRYSEPEGQLLLRFRMANLGEKEKYHLYVEIFKSPQDILMLVIRRGDLPMANNVCFYTTLHYQPVGLKIRFDIVFGGVLFTFSQTVGREEKEKKYLVLFSQMGL